MTGRLEKDWGTERSRNGNDYSPVNEKQQNLSRLDCHINYPAYKKNQPSLPICWVRLCYGQYVGVRSVGGGGGVPPNSEAGLPYNMTL